MKQGRSENSRMHWFGCGMPLGGLGAGTVDICPDGLFREWNVMNNKPLFSLPKPEIPLDASFFGVLADGQAGYLFRPEMGWDVKLNNPYHIPFVKYPEIKAEASFPEARFRYRWEKGFPVEITMRAYSSFLPHNVRDSAIPGAFFDFTVANLTQKKIDIALFQALRNLTGFQHRAELSSVFRADEYGMTLSRKDADPKAPDTGSMSLGIVSDDGKISRSYCCSIYNLRDIWEELFINGILALNDRGGKVQKQGDEGAAAWFDPGKDFSLNAAAASFTLAPGEKRQVTFVLAWHFPNLTEMHYEPKKRVPARRIGHRYNLWYKDSCEVMHDLIARRKTLRAGVDAFLREMKSSGMEKWMISAVDSQLSTLIKSSWFDEKGNFAIWEGLGHCGLDTVDVSLYGSFAVQDFFPELELSQMKLLARNCEPDGNAAHYLPGNFHCCDVDLRRRLDKTPDFLLLYWRDVRASGDLRFARKLYPAAQAAIKAFQAKTDECFIPYHLGKDQTYDQFPIKGSAPMTALLYAAGLAGMAEIAGVLGLPEDRRRYDAMCRKILSVFDERFWNGRYYSLSNDLKNHLRNEGVMVDALVGDWFRRASGGESLTDTKKTLKNLKAVLKYCSDPAGYLRNCAWPDGNTITIPRHTGNQAEWPWSGVEYAFAAELLHYGLTAEAIQVARNVYDRYERSGMRFCHIECGPHYYRAMSVWAFFQAWGGFTSDALKGRLTLDFSRTAKLWLLAPGIRGVAQWQGDALILSLKEVSFALRELQVKAPDGKEYSLCVEKRGKGKYILPVKGCVK